ncbi:MAG: ATP-binding region ATPase domain protein [Frankiales bacterium]|nr:ATP-binding region ATPase domain protein [Frankiales bacterium]
MPRISIPPSAASVAAVRHALADDLINVGTGDAVSDATLVLSELVSNAVRHATPVTGDGLVINWHVEDGGAMVVIAVTDGSADAEPRRAPPDTVSDSGRGLAIVDMIASDWGVRRGPDHKTVWARVPLRRRLAHL